MEGALMDLSSRHSWPLHSSRQASQGVSLSPAIMSSTRCFILHSAVVPFPASLSRASLVSEIAAYSLSILLQTRFMRSFSRSSILGHLAILSLDAGDRSLSSGVMDLLLLRLGSFNLALQPPAAAFLHRCGDLHLIVPPCGLMLLFLGGVQIEADRMRLFSASSDSSSLLAPFLGATTLLGQLVPHTLPG